MKQKLTLSLLVAIAPVHATQFFWQAIDTVSEDCVCYIADLRIQEQNSGRTLQDLCTLIEEMPLFLAQVTQKNLPVVVIAPEELEDIGPLDTQAPTIEGARTGLAWARAYYQLLQGHYDLSILKIPRGQHPSPEQIIAYALQTPLQNSVPLHTKRSRSEAQDSLEARVQKCVRRFALADVPAHRGHSKYTRTPYTVAPQAMIARTITLPDSFNSSTAHRYVVAGGSGFIGYHLVKRLLSEGHAVIVLDNFACSSRENVAEFATNPLFYCVEHDVTTPCTIPGHIDGIINLASVPSPDYYYRMPYETLQTGLMGTKNLIELARAKQARYLFTSTSEVYGDPLVHPQVEEYPGRVDYLGKRSQYDQSKRGAETLLKVYFDQYKLDIRIARLFNTYGPRMMLHDGRVVTNFIAAILEDKPLKIYGDGLQTRSFGYVDDTIDGLIRLLHNEQLTTEPLITNRVFNLGTPYEFTINELAEKIQKLCLQRLGKSVNVTHLPKIDATDPCKRLPNIARAQTVLGFNPHIQLDEGLEKTLAYFLNTQAK